MIIPPLTAPVPSLSDNTGILLLCEVASKPFYEQYQANYNADQDCKKAKAKYVSHPSVAFSAHRILADLVRPSQKSHKRFGTHSARRMARCR